MACVAGGLRVIDHGPQVKQLVNESENVFKLVLHVPSLQIAGPLSLLRAALIQDA